MQIKSNVNNSWKKTFNIIFVVCTNNVGDVLRLCILYKII